MRRTWFRNLNRNREIRALKARRTKNAEIMADEIEKLSTGNRVAISRLVREKYLRASTQRFIDSERLKRLEVADHEA